MRAGRGIINKTESFKYLGNTITINGKLREITERIKMQEHFIS
jgi:hypothetical protein